MRNSHSGGGIRDIGIFHLSFLGSLIVFVFCMIGLAAWWNSYNRKKTKAFMEKKWFKL